MLYSKDDVLTAVRQELAEANKTLGIAYGFTDNDYHYLGVIAAAWERLLALQPNGSKPFVGGSLPCTHTFKTTYIGVGYVAQCTKCGFVRQ